MSEWQEVSLEAVAQINPTESLPKGTMAKKIAMDALQPFTKRPSSYEVEAYNGGMKFKNGDTIVARITPCLENGKTAYIDLLDDNEVAYGSTEYIVLREKLGVTEKQFLYYFSISPIFRDVAIASMTGSSGRQRVQTDVVKKHVFEMPSLEEQKAIASVLSSLDDKIDLLHRQNTTLELMAETLFRQWFVEEAQEDWEELRLDNIASVVSGYNHKQDELSETGDYLLSMGSAIKKYGFSIEASRHIKTASISEKYLCYANDIFLTTRDVTQNAELLGSPGIIPPCIKQKVVLGSNLYKIEVKNKKLPKSIIYFLLRSELYREYVKEVASGTSVLMLKKSDLDSFSFKLPPTSTLVRLDELLSNILSKLNSNFEQEITIKKLRDNLLPKLMSGEVRL